MIKRAINTYFKSEISIGITLIVMTMMSLIIVNYDSHHIYEDFFEIIIPLNIDLINIHKDLSIREWINDALMAVFFLLVGMELKMEVMVGELSTKKKLSLPLIAAIGGVMVPVIIFYYFNVSTKENLRGFAVPTATDIAFAYGMISLFGKKISNSLKVFLVALAVIDDLIAILVIAFFYSRDFHGMYLIFAGVILIALLLLNMRKTKKISPYMVLGFFLWLMILKSGIHATVAGVLTALFIPHKIGKQETLSKFAHKIAPTVNFLILPLFAFANAGVRLDNMSFDIFNQPLVLGIICALFFGKQIGVMLLSFITVKLNIAHLPRGADWFEFYGAAIFTGIGFTMSLFIGSLAFYDNNALYDQVKIGVLAGSLLSMIYGILITYLATNKKFRKLIFKPKS